MVFPTTEEKKQSILTTSEYTSGSIIILCKQFYHMYTTCINIYFSDTVVLDISVFLTLSFDILDVRVEASRNHLPHFINPLRTLRTKENMKGSQMYLFYETSTILVVLTKSNMFLLYIGSLFDFEAVGPETENITMFLDSVGEDLFEIVDNFGNDNATGLSPLKRKLRLKKPLDREVISVSWCIFDALQNMLF